MFCCHRKVWNVQYRILQSMQAKNCGTLFSVYGICKCTGRNYLYFSNVISLIWGKQYYSYQNLTNNAKFLFWLLHIDISGLIWLCMGSKLTTRAFYITVGLNKIQLMSVKDNFNGHTMGFMFFCESMLRMILFFLKQNGARPQFFCHIWWLKCCVPFHKRLWEGSKSFCFVHIALYRKKI